MFARTRASLLGTAALIAAVAVPLALPTPAHAWVRFGFGVPGIYVGPPAYYAPPPVAYAPGAVWIAPFWHGGYWHHGYWRH
jgi:hypothetical protein